MKPKHFKTTYQWERYLKGLALKVMQDAIREGNNDPKLLAELASLMGELKRGKDKKLLDFLSHFKLKVNLDSKGNVIISGSAEF